MRWCAVPVSNQELAASESEFVEFKELLGEPCGWSGGAWHGGVLRLGLVTQRDSRELEEATSLRIWSDRCVE